MTWLLAHVVGLIWTVVAASLAGLTAAGALHRWLHPTDDLAQGEQAHAAFYATRTEEPTS